MIDQKYTDNEGNFLWSDHEYSFIVNKKRYTGNYKKSRHAFFDAESGNKICGVEQAIDIQNTTPSTIS